MNIGLANRSYVWRQGDARNSILYDLIVMNIGNDHIREGYFHVAIRLSPVSEIDAEAHRLSHCHQSQWLIHGEADHRILDRFAQKEKRADTIKRTICSRNKVSQRNPIILSVPIEKQKRHSVFYLE